MIEALDDARQTKSSYIVKAFGVFVALFISVAGYAASIEVDSDGALVERVGGGWKCETGHRLEAGICVKVVVPDNAYATNRAYGDAWMCNRGYRRNRDACMKIVLPEHAYLNSPRGDDWECHRGYRKGESSCEVVEVPENAYLTNSGYGVGWKCERGFRQTDQSCAPIAVPEHAHLDAWGHDWRCNPPYRKRGELCVAP